MKNVKDVLVANGFRFNKQFGQNFISDKNLLSAICNDASLTKEDNVLEIGPGGGALTQSLCQTANKVVCYEIDKNLKPVLDETLEGFNNVEVVFKDGLKEPLEEIEKHFNGKYKVVANLPYYITTPLIFKFVESSERVESITVMVQKEVGERIVAKPSTEEYGILSVMVDFYADASIKRNVKRQMFFPVPNVDSCVVNLVLKKLNHTKEYVELFSKIVHGAFAMRRKTLVNNLVKGIGIDKIKLENALTKMGLGLSVRGEALSTQQFVQLIKELQ